MKFTYHFVFVVFYISVTNTTNYSNFNENLLSYLKDVQKENKIEERISPLPEQSGHVEDAQPVSGGTNQNMQNPTLLEFIRVEPKQELVNDDVQVTMDTNVQNIENRIMVEGTQLQPKLEVGIETFYNKDDNTEKVTENIEQWITTHSSWHTDNLNFNEPILEPVFSRLDTATDPKDAEVAKIKSNILRNAKEHEDRLNTNLDLPKIEAGQKLGTQYFHMDPVLNMLRSQSFRRKSKKDDDSSSSSSSSSLELKDWKEEFQELWLHKKYEALNQTRPKGDTVNMAAARPWGVQCGDPEQHDMPWGSCMLAMECESEYRIYRGDIYCGRTQFICCAVQVTSYDLYQGFDVSLDDKSLSTDTEEKKGKKSSEGEKKRKDAKDRKKRKKARDKRKKKIKRTIRKIIKEIRKLLNKQFKNGTKKRKNRTKQLKKFIKKLKRQYKKDRKAVRDLHEKDMIHIDNNLLTKLNQVKAANKNFMKNETFREIVVNGTITRQGARMLLQAYPELEAFLEARKNAPPKGVRRSLSGATPLEYDIEYGYIYY